jgi:NhaA family Na+:H+ antiporter
VYALEEACEAALPPLVRIEDKLHGIVAFVIMPLFALANAGLVLSGVTSAGIMNPVTLGILAGLVIGKPAGIALASWIAVRAGAADLPAGTNWKMVNAVGWLAGIGFTMSLFVGGLAFKTPALLDSAKLGILAASVVAGVAGSFFLYRALPAHARQR